MTEPTPKEFRDAMRAFVGANRQGAGDFAQHVIGPGGQRLFDHRDTKADQMRGKVGVNLRRPPLVRIDDQGRARGTRPHSL